MAKIYVGQTNLQINFSLGADVTGHTITTASVRRPGNSILSWSLTIDDASNGSASFASLTATTLNTSGTYYLQPTITFSDGTIISGETATLKVFKAFE